MSHKQTYRILSLILLSFIVILSGCAPLLQPVTSSGSPPTPVISMERDVGDNPDVFVAPAAFQAALLQALNAGDTQKIQLWMAEPFLIGTWRADLSDTSAVDAVKLLYTEQLGAENRLELVEDADLKALMGGKDPLSIPRGEAGIMDAFLVSGWGMDGLDEAILFVSRQVDNSLKWQGWVVIKGGFSGTRLGGIQLYTDEPYGYSLYLPQNYWITQQTDSQVAIFARGEGHPGGAWIVIEPANGRTAEQVVEAVKAELGDGFNVSIDTVLDIEGTQALIVNGLPGQDPNHQLFMVRDDLLYHITFIPDDPLASDAYRQMEDLYAMIVNTFHFTR